MGVTVNSQKEAGQVIRLSKRTRPVAGNDDLFPNLHGTRVYCWGTADERNNGDSVTTIVMIN